jgi:hypothetical protein
MVDSGVPGKCDRGIRTIRSVATSSDCGGHLQDLIVDAGVSFLGLESIRSHTRLDRSAFLVSIKSPPRRTLLLIPLCTTSSLSNMSTNATGAVDDREEANKAACE